MYIFSFMSPRESLAKRQIYSSSTKVNLVQHCGVYHLSCLSSDVKDPRCSLATHQQPLVGASQGD